MRGGLRLLFCDYDGDFELAELLEGIGFEVESILPQALRQVSVGDHEAYLFSFNQLEHQKQALRTVEKLKRADLKIPLILICKGKATPEFLNHRNSESGADAYVSSAGGEAPILDALDELIGVPVPDSLKASFQIANDNREAVEDYKLQIVSLENKIEALENDKVATVQSLDRALEAQRAFYKPKLKALLEEQKTQVQTETERLKVRLSELEAKLLDREAKIKDLEATQEESIQKLRQFYQSKLKSLQAKPEAG